MFTTALEMIFLILINKDENLTDLTLCLVYITFCLVHLTLCLIHITLCLVHLTLCLVYVISYLVDLTLCLIYVILSRVHLTLCLVHLIFCLVHLIFCLLHLTFCLVHLIFCLVHRILSLRFSRDEGHHNHMQAVSSRSVCTIPQRLVIHTLPQLHAIHNPQSHSIHIPQGHAIHTPQSHANHTFLKITTSAAQGHAIHPPQGHDIHNSRSCHPQLLKDTPSTLNITTSRFSRSGIHSFSRSRHPQLIKIRRVRRSSKWRQSTSSQSTTASRSEYSLSIASSLVTALQQRRIRQSACVQCCTVEK